MRARAGLSLVAVCVAACASAPPTARPAPAAAQSDFPVEPRGETPRIERLAVQRIPAGQRLVVEGTGLVCCAQSTQTDLRASGLSERWCEHRHARVGPFRARCVDTERGVEVLLPLIVERGRWPVSIVVGRRRSNELEVEVVIDPADVSSALAAAVGEAPDVAPVLSWLVAETVRWPRCALLRPDLFADLAAGAASRRGGAYAKHLRERAEGARARPLPAWIAGLAASARSDRAHVLLDEALRLHDDARREDSWAWSLRQPAGLDDGPFIRPDERRGVVDALLVVEATVEVRRGGERLALGGWESPGTAVSRRIVVAPASAASPALAAVMEAHARAGWTIAVERVVRCFDGVSGQLGPPLSTRLRPATKGTFLALEIAEPCVPWFLPPGGLTRPTSAEAMALVRTDDGRYEALSAVARLSSQLRMETRGPAPTALVGAPVSELGWWRWSEEGPLLGVVSGVSESSLIVTPIDVVLDQLDLPPTAPERPERRAAPEVDRPAWHALTDTDRAPTELLERERRLLAFEPGQRWFHERGTQPDRPLDLPLESRGVRLSLAAGPMPAGGELVLDIVLTPGDLELRREVERYHPDVLPILFSFEADDVPIRTREKSQEGGSFNGRLSYPIVAMPGEPRRWTSRIDRASFEALLPRPLPDRVQIVAAFSTPIAAYVDRAPRVTIPIREVAGELVDPNLLVRSEPIVLRRRDGTWVAE